MTIDERLEFVARSLNIFARIHVDDDREYHERLQRLSEAQDKNARDIEALKVLLQQDTEHIRALVSRAEGR